MVCLLVALAAAVLMLTVNRDTADEGAPPPTASSNAGGP